MNRSILFVSIIACLAICNAKAQSIEPTLKLYAQYQQEKVHIHFDKDAYLPGETVWMKAYIISASKPTALSKNIYFDWTDVNGNLLLHSVSPVNEGTSSSSFAIPAGLAGGAIHVKAYTHWMLNFDTSFLYNRDIPILTPWDGTVESDKHTINIRFFPEGGDLVNGIASVVAFEAVDQHNRPVNVKGVVEKTNGEIVDSFATMHEGMGMFTFRPLSNENYTARWKDENGEIHSTTLPQAKSSGAIIRVTPSQDNLIHFQIERPADGSDNLKSLTVIGTANQQVVYKYTFDLSGKAIADGSIATAPFPGGVAQLTLFDAHMSPVAERVVFVNNHQYLFAAQLKKDIVNFNRRGRNEISIEVPDSLSANLSVSVTDAGLGYDTSNNIISDFLLSSDIRGYISNPAHYFSGNVANMSFYLDLVMRTHGWRRFKWEDVIAGRLPVIQYQPDSDYMVLKGQITPNQPSFSANDSIALLMITKDRKKHIYNLPLSANGAFTQKGILFYDSMQVVYQVNHASKINSGAALNLQTGLLTASLQRAHAGNPNFEWIRIPDVVLEKESNGIIIEDRDFSRKSTDMNFVFTPNRNDQTKTNSENASHYLQMNFPDLKFPYAAKDANEAVGDKKFASYSVNNNAGQPAPPKNNVNVLLDGVLVNMDDLKQVSMKEVLFIKFLQKTNAKDLPTLSITTRQSIDQNNILNNKTGFAVVTGYTPAREFYSPQYSDVIDDHAASDFRSTLYWNPKVVVDKNHRKVKLVFYNNDVTNKFRVVVEGMNKEGKLTRIEEILK